MTTEADKNLTEQQIWDQEIEARENPSTAKAADDPVDDDQGADFDEDKEEGGADNPPEETSTPPEPVVPDVTAQLLEQMKKIEARQRNVEGHIGGLKTAQQALNAAMEEARKSTVKSDAEAPTKNQLAEAAKSSEKWDELKESFPEFAVATEELLGKSLQGLSAGLTQEDVDARIKEQVDLVRAESEKQITQIQLNAILPDWENQVRTDKFKEWFETQDETTKELANSDQREEAGALLRLYASALQSDPTKAIQESRKQKLAQATSLPRTQSTPKAKTIDQMSESELWDYEVRKREKLKADRGY